MPFRRANKYGLLLAICVLALQACATSSALVTAREQFRYGSLDAALLTLSEAKVSARDQLLLHLDTALIAQAAEHYENSIVEFEKAYTLIEELDYLSVRDQSTALLTNDWAIRYAGELSERLWIHTFQMINFLMLDRPEGAAVEARRAVSLFEEHDDVLNADVLTRYLMALSFEAAGQADSAGVEYRKLKQDLAIEPPLNRSRDARELVVLVASGFIEPKLPGDLTIDINARIAFPYYPETYTDTIGNAPDIKIIVNSEVLGTQHVQTRLLPIARNALAKRGKAIAARQALRLAAKNELARKIENEDPLAGGIVQLMFFILEQADTRSWETLPSWLSLVRAEIPENTDIAEVQVYSPDAHGVVSHSRSVPLKQKAGSLTVDMFRLGAGHNDASHQLTARP